ncbi:putative DMT superfamily transporter inner membrane protein [Pseudovibrio sp. Ad13]|uniref:DMT family transporter n=1 Tax=Pseudovibrio sp. Ad13 TaxID=989396 RepID=UPI0007AEA02D|nr:DMT family transporter [Pseudovibrio sp. Ad13]KZK84955.1 putative DMT superfamily transporter inner membrane protein [Pseudovibrio sp. Ad13]
MFHVQATKTEMKSVLLECPVKKVPSLGPGIIAGLTASLIWGAYLSLSRVGVTAGLDGFDIAFLRYIVAGPLMLLFLLIVRRNPLKRISLLQAAVVSVLLGPPFVLLGVGGYIYAPLTHGAVIVPASMMLGGFLLARIFLSEQLGLQRIFGTLIKLIGLALIAGPAAMTSSLEIFIGDTFFIVAGMLWAGFSVLQQHWKLNALDVTTVVSVAGLLTVGPIYLSSRGVDVFTAQSAHILVTQLIVQGVLSGVVAMIAFAKSVQILGAAQAAMFPALVPVFALIIGVPLTGETPSVIQWGGLATIGIGLTIVVMSALKSTR